VALTLFLGACSSDDPKTETREETGSGATSSTSRTERAQTDDGGGGELEVTTVASKLNTVWAMKFDSDGKLWFTQRGGRLQQLGGPGRNIPGVVEQGEGGLLGLELDDEGRIYLMFSAARDNRIVRLDDLQAEPEVLVDGIRKAAIHNGGRLRFSPDGKTLYAGTGDAGDTSLPPDADTLNGKILAIDPSTKKATVFTKGHRNPQGLCFDADGRFLSTEHGPDRGDEINVIEKGKDYGWPESAGDGIKNWTPTIAPAGCVVYDADLIPEWKGSMLFTTLKEQDLRRLTFAADGSVADEEILYDGEYGRLRDVAVAPDGSVYVATSSRDSRGNPTDDDDRILRIAPAKP
jgi:glucose/arabinose dehydrogenase